MFRLLNWATDIEAQLGLQRQELKRSRIELASAQEVRSLPLCLNAANLETAKLSAQRWFE